MAKRRRGTRRRKNFVAIPVNIQQALGTLADETVLNWNLLDQLFAEDFYAISAELVFALNGHTAGEGPIEFGLAHGDLTTAEIKECIDADWNDPDNIIAREQARRPVRRCGSYHGLSTVEVPNNGNPKKYPIKMMIGEDHELKAFVMNHTGGALTTGSIVTITGTVFGRWVR